MRYGRMWAVVLALGVGAPGMASAASAVFYDPGNGAFGYAMNKRSVSNALQDALAGCVRGSPNCREQMSTAASGYSAIYTGTVAVGVALSEKSDDAARRKAAAMCRRVANDCALAIAWREIVPVQGTVHPLTHPYPPPPPPGPAMP
ncbi:DUF4189 domain-containing protein [Stenotrophomonas sp. LGBM10]|uniref:DUF4189 domain-containing protein n=1 Tax=Stenotrophomonas sp. LGBM10 TaxID=3390038 RepID=UPI00398B6BC8